MGVEVDESQLLATGVFNWGFIGVGAEGLPFVEWWCGRGRDAGSEPTACARQSNCVGADLVPCFFDHVILSQPGYGVACWNLHASELVFDDGRYLVAGNPLKSFHFAGFDPRKALS